MRNVVDINEILFVRRAKNSEADRTPSLMTINRGTPWQQGIGN
jgi:hypothetical protein